MSDPPRTRTLLPAGPLLASRWTTARRQHHRGAVTGAHAAPQKKSPLDWLRRFAFFTRPFRLYLSLLLRPFSQCPECVTLEAARATSSVRLRVPAGPSKGIGIKARRATRPGLAPDPEHSQTDDNHCENDPPQHGGSSRRRDSLTLLARRRTWQTRMGLPGGGDAAADFGAIRAKLGCVLPPRFGGLNCQVTLNCDLYEGVSLAHLGGRSPGSLVVTAGRACGGRSLRLLRLRSRPSAETATFRGPIAGLVCPGSGSGDVLRQPVDHPPRRLRDVAIEIGDERSDEGARLTRQLTG